MCVYICIYKYVYVYIYIYSKSEIKARIRKARGAFAALKNIWKTNKIGNRTKIRLFKSNVLSVLLCGGIMEGHQRHIPDAGSFSK